MRVESEVGHGGAVAAAAFGGTGRPLAIDVRNLIQLIGDSIDWVGEIQVADVPGRCVPGTGEISYPAIAQALHRAGYTGVVAMEAFASGDSDVALQRFRQAFSGS